MLGLQSRKTRTAVFSGTTRTNNNTRLLSLEDLCLNVLKDNFMYITYLGNAPYYLIKPVLEKCNPDQLFKLEDFNPELVSEDDELWELHCKQEFKGKIPEEDESWRELFVRLKYEREVKLKSITANIHRKSQKAAPVRTTKLAFVESIPKPPRGIKRAQETNGTKFTDGPRKFDLTKSKSSCPRNSSFNAALSSNGPAAKKLKKTAPLMKKSKDMMKSRFRR